MIEEQHTRITVFPETPEVRVIKQGDNKYDVYYVPALVEAGAVNRQVMQTVRNSLGITGQARIVTGHKALYKIKEVIKGA